MISLQADLDQRSKDLEDHVVKNEVGIVVVVVVVVVLLLLLLVLILSVCSVPSCCNH